MVQDRHTSTVKFLLESHAKTLPVASKARFAVLVTLLLAIPFLWPQPRRQQHKSASKASGDTSFVSCYGKTGRLVGSRFARSSVLVSPDGRRRAYAEVEAVVPRAFWKKRQQAALACANTTKLFVAGTEPSLFGLVFLQVPTVDEPGNGIELVDWSRDGRYLLMSLTPWGHESDSVAFNILLYDAEYEIFLQPDHDLLFSQHFGKKCSVELKARGFFSGGSSPIVEAWDAPIELPPDQEPCLRKQGLWLLDWRNYRVSPLRDDFQLERFGRKTSHRPQTKK